MTARVLTAEEFFQALVAAGVVRDGECIDRVVIDVRADHFVVLDIQRVGDERLIKVVPGLDGVEIRETSAGAS